MIHDISFNPFFTDDYKFSVEKKDSIKTLLLALWKGEDEKITKTESGYVSCSYFFERDGIERDDIFRKNYYVNNY